MFLRPMLASLAEAPLEDPHLAYEPKYDGIRAIVEIVPSEVPEGSPRSGPPSERERGWGPASSNPGQVRLWSRLGNEKTRQFPEIVAAFEAFSSAAGLDSPIVVDGELVALDERGEPTGFQRLQSRIHLNTPGLGPGVAYIAFDLLRQGGEDLCRLPLSVRRQRLERLFQNSGPSPEPRGLTTIRLSEFHRGSGAALMGRAHERGWEGLIAKHLDSQYKAGRRTADWLKVKLVRRQEFVVGGWTDPRASRPYFGALLLGVYATDGGLEYVGHTGSGFTDAELARLWRLLVPLETSVCPFRVKPKTNERPHWVTPTLMAEVKFTEWTDDDKLRHPIYLGLRDDKDPKKVIREPEPVIQRAAARARPQSPEAPRAKRLRPSARGWGPARTDIGKSTQVAALVKAVLPQLDQIEARRGDGLLRLPDDHTLKVTNLKKVFWPKRKLTKGDLFRYYLQVAPSLLPVIVDRPLIMKRYPNGVTAQAFYQQRAPDKTPPGVRVMKLDVDREVPRRVIGGDLITLLYTTQIAAISEDPWFSRVGSINFADHAALDLDPSEGVGFKTVLDVARAVHDELERLGVEAWPKTSGSEGLHIYIPMPPRTPYEAGLLFCQIIATVVAEKHPRIATIERSVKARGRRVYVDYLQNIRGKSLASAYSARASAFAGVSAPLTWKEVHAGVDREAFTIETMPARLRKAGDLWAPLLASKGANLEAVLKYAPASRR